MHAKKSLGQNFLKDTKTLNTIVDSTLGNLRVLEIGPGKGALTKRLLAAGHVVTAIEKDHRLIEPLQTMFALEIDSGQLRLIEGDGLIDTPEEMGLVEQQFQVVANLPYYITGLYLRQTLESGVQPKQIILLLQKEVVDRITAQDNKGSILSISVKAYGNPRKLCNVNKKHFTPEPKVDSAVLLVENISRDRFTESGLTEEQFFTVLKTGFASKRKTLANNLKNLLAQFNIDFTDLSDVLNNKEKIRPEELSTTQWFEIAKKIYN